MFFLKELFLATVLLVGQTYARTSAGGACTEISDKRKCCSSYDTRLSTSMASNCVTAIDKFGNGAVCEAEVCLPPSLALSRSLSTSSLLSHFLSLHDKPGRHALHVFQCSHRFTFSFALPHRHRSYFTRKGNGDCNEGMCTCWIVPRSCAGRVRGVSQYSH